jgi:acyl dehydratase
MTAQALTLDFVYPTYDVNVTREAQAEKLACCDVDPGVFGDYVDITHFAVETIMAAKHGGASINGSVHVSQEFEQFEPVRLGETLTLSGRVTAVESNARGAMITSAFEFSRASGVVPLRLSRTSLKADPARMRPPAGWSTVAAVELASDWLEVASHRLVPENVARYSVEAQNLIHSDPAVAGEFGFRAPIAGGLMAARMMMAYLWRDGPLQSLRMSVNFRRPMFWDEQLRLFDVGGAGARLKMIRASDNKVVNDATIDYLG